jgi:hypothetical protein
MCRIDSAVQDVLQQCSLESSAVGSLYLGSLCLWVSRVAQSIECLATDRAIRGSISGRGERIFPLVSVFRSVVRPTQPLVHWVQRVKRDLGATLTTHPHLVPRSRMVGAIPLTLGGRMGSSGRAFLFVPVILNISHFVIHLQIQRYADC